MKIEMIASMAVLLIATACNQTTAPHTSILKMTFSEAQGGPPAALMETPLTQHLLHLTVADGAAEIDVLLDVVQGPKGRYLHGVEIVATRNGGGSLTASIPSGAMPINRGTVENAIAALPLRVEWRRENFGSSTLRQTSIELVADGSATAY